MSYDGYISINDSELINVARTSRLAKAIGLDTFRIKSELVQAIQGRFVGDGFGLGEFGLVLFGGPVSDYDDITKSPWYDAGYPASAEFAGIVPLAMQGLDDSTLESSVIEYITDGGHSGKGRNATLSIVASVALIATTERGAEFGKRWMDRTLRSPGPQVFCAGSDMTYMRYPAVDAPMVHRRDVRLTRGTSITRKKVSACSTTWLATFTLTAADPYEYGDPEDKITSLKGATSTGPGVTSTGFLYDTEAGCPVYSYDPLYDPLFPALVPSPVAPNFLPTGWSITEGLGYYRSWARITPLEPTALNVVPLIKLSCTTEARMIRVSVWPMSYSADAKCDPLFSVVVSYLPANVNFYIDGEQKAAYTWDGSSAFVRRTDSLVYSPDGYPLEWTAFNDPAGLLVTMDSFYIESSRTYQGNGTVTASLSLLPKSD